MSIYLQRDHNKAQFVRLILDNILGIWDLSTTDFVFDGM